MRRDRRGNKKDYSSSYDICSIGAVYTETRIDLDFDYLHDVWRPKASNVWKRYTSLSKMIVRPDRVR